MAEARQAVGLIVTPDGGLQFDFGEDAIHLVFHAGQRAIKKRLARALNTLKTGIFPLKLEVVLGNIALLSGLFSAGVDPTFGLSAYILNLFSISNWFLLSLLTAVMSTLMLVVSIRYLLRLLFSYQAWMFFSRSQMKNPPLTFKLWMLAVRLVTSIQNLESGKAASGKPMLYSYQGSLPYLPLPKLKKTLDKHLESVKPVLSDSEYKEMEKLSKEFETSLAPTLQKYLLLKWIWSENYVSDWWEEYVYLRGRSSLMINSNFYGIDALYLVPTHKQAARAANAIHLAFCFRRALLRQELLPVLVQGIIPMCSRQYDRLFNTSRIPGEVTDVVQHEKDSTHVAVMHKGRFFRLGCYNKGRLLSPAEIQIQIDGILNDATASDEGESQLAVLTAANRTTWANIRQKHFRRGINKESLDAVEKAAFVVVLDDYEYDYDPNDETKLNHFARMMLHGKGYDRWFDKSFCICIGPNGRMGFNAEHSWADAPVMGHFCEYLITHDLKILGYSPSGDCLGTVTERPPKASKLRWDLQPEVLDTISTSLKSAQELVDDLELFILVHSAFGKGFIKTCNLSPDAFIQMALQLAYYRETGKFCLTYEASMTRLFREGRTETVRPCSMQSSQWVRAMQNPKSTEKERIDLLQTASLNHQRLYQEAMTGQGIDRHLFCLYVVSKYLEKESPFLTKVFSEPWRLSTSQTPVRGDYLDIQMHPDIVSAGGGFGPVADDGYGVSYIITGEDKIFFHVSAKKKCPTTDAARFARQIEKAMSDMRLLHQK